MFLISLVSSLGCSRGLENDSYPGVCGLYTDSNKDWSCDYSEDLNPKSQERVTSNAIVLIEDIIF